MTTWARDHACTSTFEPRDRSIDRVVEVDDMSAGKPGLVVGALVHPARRTRLHQYTVYTDVTGVVVERDNGPYNGIRFRVLWSGFDVPIDLWWPSDNLFPVHPVEHPHAGGVG